MPYFVSNQKFDHTEEMLSDRFYASYPNDEYKIISKKDDFILVGPKDHPERIRFFILHRREVIGMLGALDDKPYPRVTMSFIKPRFRSMGFGFELYMALINQFGGLMSDTVITPEARKIWDKLNKTSGIVVSSREDTLDGNGEVSSYSEVSSYHTRYIASRSLMEDRYHDGKRFYRELIPHADPNIFRDPEWKPEIPNWPLDALQLREIEKQILQRPDWLYYYARFDWTSWTECSANWWYDKNRNVFSFYDIPAISYFNNTPTPDRLMLQLKPDGSIVPQNSQYSDLHQVLPTALRLCQEVVNSALTKMKWLRGTYYLRFGMWPKNERSQNFLIRDRIVFEKGVSVYHVEYDLDEDRWAIDPTVDEATIAGTMQTLIYSNRPIFLVQGTELDEEGSDGEPLLHDVKLIKQLSKDEVYCPGIFDPKEDI
jgi:hypothetical protein